MKFGALWTLLAALFLAGCNPSAVLDNSEGEIARYHEHWNKGGIEPIWKEADDEFRANVAEADYIRLMGDFQEIFGPMQSTERESFNINTHNGVTTIAVVMRTQFANGVGKENFEFVERGDQTKLKSYHVDSELLAGYDFSGGKNAEQSEPAAAAE
jgi:hypothetical protein